MQIFLAEYPVFDGTERDLRGFIEESMDRHGTWYKIVEETEQPDGSLIIKIKRQNNTQPVGDYLD